MPTPPNPLRAKVPLLALPLVLTLVFAAPAAALAGVPSVGRSAPAIVGVGLCPFELCKFGNWQALERLPVYRAEGDPTRVVTHLARQEAFVALTGNLHTLGPGEVRLQRAHVARGPQLRVDPRGYTAKRNATPSTLRLKAGDVVQVLTSIGEGYYLIRHRGKVYEVLRFWEETGSPYKAPGELRSPMRNEWWVQVRTKGGQRGWLRLTGDRGPAFKILDPVG